MYNPLLEAQYQTHGWTKAHETTITDPATFETPFTMEECDRLTVCNSDSEAAARFEKLLEDGRVVKDVFLFDQELLAAGHDDILAGGLVESLVEEWNGHAPGTLVMTVYTESGYILYVQQ